MCQKCSSGRMVDEQSQWHQVLADLDAEKLKVAGYDHVVVSMMGDVTDLQILDYGAGPGVMALALRKLGADVRVWDTNPEMRAAAAKKIGAENVYRLLDEIPHRAFDRILCNLVLCIVPQEEVHAILDNIRLRIKENGRVHIGFCNPRIFQVEESNLDYRFPTGEPYEQPHRYRKVKKEGGYEIIEDHRPEEWYEAAFELAGFKVTKKQYTPQYELNKQQIQDFVVYELQTA